MVIKLNFSTGTSVTDPESTAFVEATAIYYDPQYSEIIVRMMGNNTDLAFYAPQSIWDIFSKTIEDAVARQQLVDATTLAAFKSVSREGTCLHWKPEPKLPDGEDPFHF